MTNDQMINKSQPKLTDKKFLFQANFNEKKMLIIFTHF